MIAVAEGRVDGANALEFHEALEAAISPDDTGMVLDFEGISYISSAGLRVVLLVAKTLQKQKAKMAVCSLSESIREIFEISGFDKIIPVHGSRADAVAGSEADRGSSPQPNLPGFSLPTSWPHAPVKRRFSPRRLDRASTG